MQTDNINFRDIWNNKNADIPNIQQIKTTAEKYRKKQLSGTVLMMICFLATAFGMIFIWNVINFKMFTTSLGIILILIALALFIYLSYQNVNVIRTINPSISNQEYLSSLKKLQRQQLYMQTKGISIYYILLCAGFAFYFYEFVLFMSTTVAFLAYGSTFLWLAIVWFFLRPRQIRKQNQKISKIIDSLETIEKDLGE